MRRGRPRYPGLLTPREQEVLGLLQLGLTNREIADRLEITSAGAAYHVSEILSKLDVTSREEAAALGPRLLARQRRFRLGAFLSALLPKPSFGLTLRLVGPGVIGAAGLGLVLLALGLVSMQDREADPATTTADTGLGKLAYVVDGDVWVKQLPDGPPSRLTSDGLNFGPVWSASGEWLLFQRREGAPEDIQYPTWLSRSDGGSQRRLTAAKVAWSPAEDLLAYVDDDGVIVVEAPDGSGRRDLVSPGAESSLSSPVWSPDGTILAYVESTRREASTHLKVISSSGGSPRELLAHDGGQLIVQACSGDQRWLLVWRGAVISASLQADGLQLWQVPLDGGGAIDLRQALTYDDFVDPQPDGALVAIVQGGGRNAWENKALAVHASGADAALTPDGIAVSSPAWSPDGSKIAYVEAPDVLGVPGGDQAKAGLAKRRVWIADVSSSSVTQITWDETYRDERPTWSRDSKSLLMARLDGEGAASIWVLSLASGRAEELVDGLSLGDALTTPQPDLWFGYYGHIAWEQYFDWWQPEG
jgi:DNA-binding CsgD family transcriptional regulator